jgi:hypothetical protein
VFGRKKFQLYFGNVDFVVLCGIVLIILGCVWLCLAYYVGMPYLYSTTSYSYGCLVVSICICMM